MQNESSEGLGVAPATAVAAPHDGSALPDGVQNQCVVDRVKLRMLAAKAPEGPWFAADDEASDAPPHSGSGLALVDTGRSMDWPIARLTEWNTASYVAAVDPQTVLSLLDEIDRLKADLKATAQILAESDAFIHGAFCLRKKHVGPFCLAAISRHEDWMRREGLTGAEAALR